MAYNEAITKTNNQLMLMVFVHNRYEESNHLLAVSSVTANLSMSSGATIQAGCGDSDGYDGNPPGHCRASTVSYSYSLICYTVLTVVLP